MSDNQLLLWKRENKEQQHYYAIWLVYAQGSQYPFQVRLDDSLCTSQWPVYYGKGRVGYDNPDRVPEAVKKQVRRVLKTLFNEARDYRKQHQ